MDLGRGIIKDMILDVDEQQVDALTEWLNKRDNEDALVLGFEYNRADVECLDVDAPQCVLDEVFGEGYICALQHMQEILNNVK